MRAMNEAEPLPPLPPRLVLDTNVVMALWHFDDPGLAALKAFCALRDTTLLSRADCLDELGRVLAYRQFGIDAARQQLIQEAYLQRVACLPEPDEAAQAAVEALPRCKDRDDQKFLAVAWLGHADLLLTRDKLVLKLGRKSPFREHLRILTPEHFEQELRARLSG
jgi:putative PIN family toxin of toxin-antitoxin system